MTHNQPGSQEHRDAGRGKAAWRRSVLWRAGRVCLLGLATLLTLWVLYVLQENWRGHRAWENYKAKMEAQGAVFELAKLVPPPVPDEQNFAMTPLLEPLLDMYPPGTTNSSRWRNEEGRKRVESIELEDPKLNSAIGEGTLPGEGTLERPQWSDWKVGERTRLQDWQRYYRHSTVFPSWPEPRTAAQDVLKALSRYDAELDELEVASHQPYARFNVHYEEENPAAILLPHLGALRQLSKVLWLRAVAELQAGDTEAAFADVNLMLTLADSIKDEPMLISHLVRLAMLEITEQTLWEGLCDHRWSDAQLKEFQQRLAGMDLLKELKRSMMAERTFGTEILKLIIHKPEMVFELTDMSGSPEVSEAQLVISRLIPKGWLYFELVNYNELFDDYLLNVLPDEAVDLNATRVQEAGHEFSRQLSDLSSVKAFMQHRLLSKMLLPALDRVPERSARAEAMKDMAIVAMALERYHLAHHNYPDSLDVLAPADVTQLPKDPVTHENFCYEVNPDGSFRLWSVGWNGIDDGGKVLCEEHSGERRSASKQLDWVWPSVQGMRFQEVSD